MNKKVALISSFCNSKEKLDVLQSNIKELKQLAFDVIVISPLTLPKEIVSICDYFFYTKENKILRWPLNVERYWYRMGLPNKDSLLFFTPSEDYGWTGLNHVKRLTEIALTFDYEHFYHLIYDLEIDSNVKNLLNNPVDKWISSFQRREVKVDSSLHLMIFNKENVKKLLELVTLDNYLDFLKNSEKGRATEVFVDTLREKLDCEKSNFYVKDKIYYNENFFNHSKITRLRFFIEKNSADPSANIRICFYENMENLNVEVSVNDKKSSLNINGIYIFDCGVNHKDLRSATVTLKNETMDLIPVIESMPHSFMKSGPDIYSIQDDYYKLYPFTK